MITPRHIPGFLLVLSICLSVYSCDEVSTTAGTDEVESILQEIKTLHCRSNGLEERIRLVWDDVNDVLASALPESVTEEEKEMILSVKNAPLIRMFEAYDSLEPAIHQLVDSAEVADRMAVDSFAQINSRIKQLERERMQLFAEAERVSEERLESLRSRYDEVMKAPCADKY